MPLKPRAALQSVAGLELLQQEVEESPPGGADVRRHVTQQRLTTHVHERAAEHVEMTLLDVAADIFI